MITIKALSAQVYVRRSKKTKQNEQKKLVVSPQCQDQKSENLDFNPTSAAT